jgi:hypothetical protein
MALRSDVVATVLDDGALLLDLQTKYFYLLNSSAWAMVRPFEDGANLDQIRAAARAMGGAQDSVDGFIDGLLDEALLEECDEAATSAVDMPGPWTEPTIERQAQPLQRVMVNAFDPSVPLAE